MSRIRVIEPRISKDTLLVRNTRHGPLRVFEDCKSKDDTEKSQINDLLQKLPKLDKIFEVHKKIGEGTFSSVYLGSLRQHSGLPDSEKKWFAIKHLVPTAHPARIEHELRCLQDMGGRNHVIGVELCLRHLDTIVFVMPYIPHRKFSEYIVDMDAAELQRYMRALLAALQHVHSFGVIHRDVKPSNFLYDRENQRYLLVDFGLAQRMCPAEDAPAHHQLKRPRTNEQDDSEPEAKRTALDLSVRGVGPGGGEPGGGGPGGGEPGGGGPGGARPAVAPTQPRLPVHVAVKEACGATRGAVACGCAGRGGVCAACARRAPARAPRAGTQGFRPPEVLLKVRAQGPGVDTWAAGVVLASALTGRYPFFRASDDVTALAELADLLGTEALQKAALAMGRRIVTSSVRHGLCLRKLCARLRGAPAPPPGAPAPPPGAPAPPPGAAAPPPGAPAPPPGAAAPPPGAPAPPPGAPAPPPGAPAPPPGAAAPPPGAPAPPPGAAAPPPGAPAPPPGAPAPPPGAPAPPPGAPAPPPGAAAPPPGAPAPPPGAAAPPPGAAAPSPGAPAPPCRACRLPQHRCLCLDEHIEAQQVVAGRWVCGFPDAAFALAAALLQPLPARRPSAAAALRHAFLTEPLPPPH